MTSIAPSIRRYRSSNKPYAALHSARVQSETKPHSINTSNVANTSFVFSAACCAALTQALIARVASFDNVINAFVYSAFLPMILCPYGVLARACGFNSTMDYLPHARGIIARCFVIQLSIRAMLRNTFHRVRAIWFALQVRKPARVARVLRAAFTSTIYPNCSRNRIHCQAVFIRFLSVHKRTTKPRSREPPRVDKKSLPIRTRERMQKMFIENTGAIRVKNLCTKKSLRTQSDKKYLHSFLPNKKPRANFICATRVSGVRCACVCLRGPRFARRIKNVYGKKSLA